MLRNVDTEDEETALTLSHVHTNTMQIWRAVEKLVKLGCQ